MRLTRLELSGFKSFADDLVLPFENGVTAIVGPNGCGKSNVSDAVRWVLGEQRARVLRGSKMDEVIFQGSTTRKPTNIAEVALYFDNSAGVLPISYAEVVIKRRLSRSGQSEYFINNSPVRLRDVQDLLRGTGLGTDAGVVIEARMIDRLLSDKAEERRSLFEEAAGIGLYRDRRNSTERRLGRTKDDLQRLDDLIGEVHTQVRSLARQKGKAERHKQFTGERFQLVMTLTRRDLKRLDDQQRELAAQLETRRLEIPKLAQRLAEAQRRRDERIQGRASTEAQRAELERRLADLRVELEKLEGDLNLGGERLAYASDRKIKAAAEKEEAERLAAQAAREHDAAAREQTAARTDLASVQTELDLRSTDEEDTRNRVGQHRRTVQEIGERLQEMAETTRSLLGEKSALETEIEDVSNEQSRAALRLQQAREGVDRLTAIVESARTEGQERQGAFQRATAEMESARHALVAAQEMETAAKVEKRSFEQEAAQLSARVQALEELERNRVGLAPAARQLLEAASNFGEGAVLGPLIDFLKPATGEAELAERALTAWMHAVLVRDGGAVRQIKEWHRATNPGSLVLLPLDPGPSGPALADSTISVEALHPAEAWVNTLLHGVTLADADGAVLVGANGAVYLHDTADHSGPLGRREELESNRLRLSEVEVRLADSTARLEQATQQIGAAETQVAQTTVNADAQRARHREAATALEDAERNLERTTRERHEAGEAATRLDERLAGRRARLQEVAGLAARAEQDRNAFEEELKTQKTALEQTERAQAEAQEKRVRWQVEEAQVSARERAAGERQARSANEAESHRDRAAALAQELAGIEKSEIELTRLQQSRRDGIAERRIAVAEIETAATTAVTAVRGADEALTASDTELAETREAQQGNTETLHRVEIELTELAGRRTALIERVEGEWHKSLEVLLAESEEMDGDIEAMRAESERLQRAIEAIGPVNPLAVEEHEQELERFEFLSGQRADLVEARDGLWRALREMDETARGMFAEMFEVVRTNYATVFDTLFEGGTCDLQLADPNDPLNSDIDIHAAPRGKRTQRIHLLSSGERALVAISLLFAIYLAKPSPFCLLDEVDAPLDDSNVLRFVRLLDEFKDETQFIVITHNPRTMQVADSVYGVTMEEPGVSKIVGVRLGEVEPVAS